nr:hypothetical protein [Flavobacterium sp. ASV13]
MQTQNIYISKKKVRNNIIAYSFFILFFLWGFWYGTGKFFTEDFYYPSMILLMPFCVFAMLIVLIKEIRFLSKNTPFITLSDEGIRFYGKYPDQIGVLKWEDTERCADININGFLSENYLIVYANNPLNYTQKIKEGLQRHRYFKNSKKTENALLWVETRRLNCNLIELKKQIFQMIDANKKITQ